MKGIQAKKYYLFASFLVILVTIALYKGVDVVASITQEPKVLYQVYSVPATSVPILKEKLYTEDQAATASAQTSLTYEVFAQSITAKSAYVEDLSTGTILFERNSDRILLPASTTKLMTALTALEKYQLTDVVTVPELPKINGLKYEFAQGEQITVADLIKAALIQSNNDAAYILAFHADTGIEGFVADMNKKAQELQLKSTQYKNPAGFDDDTQRSSARDLVILSKAFMQHEFLASVVATKEAVITDISGEYTHFLTTTHQLLGVDPTVIGIKTGTTQGAAQVLITQFKRNDKDIIVVVMGSEDRYLETTRLIDWVFDSYVWINPQDLI